MKIASIYGNKSNKNIIVAWEGNYHGKTLNAQMLSGQYSDHYWINNFDKKIIHLPFPYPWTLEKYNMNGKQLFYKHLSILKKEELS